MDFQYVTDLTANLTDIGGGQLVDVDGNCLSYSLNSADPTYNFVTSYGEKETRLQFEKCIQPASFNSSDPAQVQAAKRQLWSAETISFSHDLVYLRNVCTDLVIMKEKEENDPKVYKDMSCGEPSFHYRLVN